MYLFEHLEFWKKRYGDGKYDKHRSSVYVFSHLRGYVVDVASKTGDLLLPENLFTSSNQGSRYANPGTVVGSGDNESFNWYLTLGTYSYYR